MKNGVSVSRLQSMEEKSVKSKMGKNKASYKTMEKQQIVKCWLQANTIPLIYPE